VILNGQLNTTKEHKDVRRWFGADSSLRAIQSLRRAASRHPTHLLARPGAKRKGAVGCPFYVLVSCPVNRWMFAGDDLAIFQGANERQYPQRCYRLAKPRRSAKWLRCAPHVLKPLIAAEQCPSEQRGKI